MSSVSSIRNPSLALAHRELKHATMMCERHAANGRHDLAYKWDAKALAARVEIEEITGEEVTA